MREDMVAVAERRGAGAAGCGAAATTFRRLCAAYDGRLADVVGDGVVEDADASKRDRVCNSEVALRFTAGAGVDVVATASFEGEEEREGTEAVAVATAQDGTAVEGAFRLKDGAAFSPKNEESTDIALNEGRRRSGKQWNLCGEEVCPMSRQHVYRGEFVVQKMQFSGCVL